MTKYQELIFTKEHSDEVFMAQLGQVRKIYPFWLTLSSPGRRVVVQLIRFSTKLNDPIITAIVVIFQ